MPALQDHVHDLKCEMAAEVLRSSGRLLLKVTGWSMMPSVWPGDTLLIESISVSDASEGDLVLYARERRLVVHRLVANGTGDSTIMTRGDALPENDPAILKRDLLGKVSFIVRNGRCLEPSRRLGPSQRAFAAVVRNSEVATGVAARVHNLLRASDNSPARDRSVSSQS